MRDSNSRTIRELKNDCDFLLNSIKSPLVDYRNVAEVDLDGFIEALDDPIIDKKLTNITVMTLYSSKTDNGQDKRNFLASDARRLKNVKTKSKNETVDIGAQVCRESVAIAVQTEPEPRVDCDVQTVVNQAATNRLKKTVFAHRIRKRHKDVNKEKRVERKEDSTQMYEHVTFSDLLCVEWINKSLFNVAMNPANLIVDDKLRNASETTMVSSNSCNEDFLLSDK